MPTTITHTSNAVNIGAALLHKNEKANVFAQSNGNVLFNLGAQVSLIKQETADSLGAKRLRNLSENNERR